MTRKITIGLPSHWPNVTHLNSASRPHGGDEHPDDAPHGVWHSSPATFNGVFVSQVAFYLTWSKLIWSDLTVFQNSFTFIDFHLT